MSLSCVQPSYWCGTRQDRQRRGTITVSNEGDTDSRGGELGREENFEADPRNLEPGIQIQNLTKRFKSDKKAKVGEFLSLSVSYPTIPVLCERSVISIT